MYCNIVYYCLVIKDVDIMKWIIINNQKIIVEEYFKVMNFKVLKIVNIDQSFNFFLKIKKYILYRMRFFFN